MAKKTSTAQAHYIHRISAVLLERLVGVFVLSAIIIIVGLVFFQLQSSHLLDDKIKYNAYLVNAQGISTETLVNVSGIEIGQVQTIDITQDNKIHVQFYVYKTFQRLLRTDSTGSLNKLSVIGNASIIISAGSTNLPVLQENAVISIEEPVSADELIAKITPIVTDLNDIIGKVSDLISAVEPKQIKDISTSLTSTVNNLEIMSQHIIDGKGVIGQILYNKEIEEKILSSVQGIDDLIVKSKHVINTTENSIVQAESVLKEGEIQLKSISQLIKPAVDLLASSNTLIKTIQPTAELIKKEVNSLPELINKMNSLLDDTNQTLQNAQQVWPLSEVIPAHNSDTRINGQPIDE